MSRRDSNTPQALPDVISEVYEDEGYMVPYMWAAILIYPFWPSMVNHIAMYRDEFVKALPAEARVLELASGHGVLSLLAAQERTDLRLEGLDISPPAVAVANRLLAVLGHASRVKVRGKRRSRRGTRRCRGRLSRDYCRDALQSIWRIQGLSSKPSPAFFRKTGRVFFSTAIESAQRDHLYEFNHESQVVKLAKTRAFASSDLSVMPALRLLALDFSPVLWAL